MTYVHDDQTNECGGTIAHCIPPSSPSHTPHSARSKHEIAKDEATYKQTNVGMWNMCKQKCPFQRLRPHLRPYLARVLVLELVLERRSKVDVRHCAFG